MDKPLVLRNWNNWALLTWQAAEVGRDVYTPYYTNDLGNLDGIRAYCLHSANYPLRLAGYIADVVRPTSSSEGKIVIDLAYPIGDQQTFYYPRDASEFILRLHHLDIPGVSYGTDATIAPIDIEDVFNWVVIND